MAMYLQQKDVEATVLVWIQAVCMLISDDVVVEAPNSVEDIRELLDVLKGQRNEWKTVRSPHITQFVFSSVMQKQPALVSLLDNVQ
jgi:hypothetical protein